MNETPDTEFIPCDTRTQDGLSCPARSLVHAFFKPGELHFCGHHANKYMTKLSEAAHHIVDDREEVSETVRVNVKVEA